MFNLLCRAIASLLWNTLKYLVFAVFLAMIVVKWPNQLITLLGLVGLLACIVSKMEQIDKDDKNKEHRKKYPPQEKKD